MPTPTIVPTRSRLLEKRDAPKSRPAHTMTNSTFERAPISAVAACPPRLIAGMAGTPNNQARSVCPISCASEERNQPM